MQESVLSRISIEIDTLKAEIDRCKRFMEKGPSDPDELIKAVRKLRALNRQLNEARARRRSLTTSAARN